MGSVPVLLSRGASQLRPSIVRFGTSDLCLMRADALLLLLSMPYMRRKPEIIHSDNNADFIYNLVDGLTDKVTVEKQQEHHVP